MQDHHSTSPFHNRWLLAAFAVVLVAVIVMAVIREGRPNPVPADIRKNAGFAVYYPDTAALPDGYSLDRSSFRQADPGVIVFSITHNGQRLAISEEAQPGGSAVSDFMKNYIPLHSALSTKLGQAQIGAYGRPPDIRTVVSLTINKGPWLVMTAPGSINQDDLKKIIQTFRK